MESDNPRNRAFLFECVRTLKVTMIALLAIISVLSIPSIARAATGEVQFSVSSAYQFGSSGSYGNNGNVFSNMFDGNLSSGWDAAAASGGYAGLDLTTPAQVTRLHLAPRTGDIEGIYGATFQAATTSSSTGPWTTLYTIPTYPFTPQNQYTEYPINTAGKYYRYYRIVSATGQYGDMSEMRMIGYASGTTPYIPVAPVVNPTGGYFATSTLVNITSLTTDASIYYTTDGTAPGFSGGVPTGTTQTYTGPFLISNTGTTTVEAIAVSAGTYVSDVSIPAYFHIGGGSTPFIPYQNWYDSNGNLIEAHDGNISYFNGLYYWYGETFNGSSPEVEKNGLTVYSSPDLLNWTYRGMVAMGNGSLQLQRPSVLYNSSTNQYVLWARNAGKVFIATSSSPTGLFSVATTTLYIPAANNQINLFQDTNGTAYVVYCQNGNYYDEVAQLNPDYLSVSANTLQLPNLQRGSVSMFLRNGVYFMVNSANTDEVSSLTEYSTSSSPLGTWSSLVNPFTSTGGASTTIAYNSEVSSVLNVPGRTDGYIYMGDTFNSTLDNSRYMWMPITFPTVNTMSISYLPNWTLDSAFASTNPAAAATNLVVTPGSSSNALSWTNNETRGFNLYIDRATNTSFTQNVVSIPVAATTTSYTDSYSVSNATTYYYRIRTVNASGTGNSPTVSSSGVSTSISASPTSIYQSSTSTVNLTGSLTSWTSGTPGTPTFTLSGGTGASIASQVVNGTSSASLSIYSGTATGTLTITDPSTGSTATITVIPPIATPVVSAISASPISTSTVTISWTTSTSSDSLINYGTSTPYTASSTYSSSLVTSHSVSLSGLLPSTTYHYQIVTVGAYSNGTTSADQTFTTSAIPAPVTSAVASSTTQTTATITWTTDQAASSTVNYGLTGSYGSASTTATLVTSHTVSLAGLTSNTLYHFQVAGANSYGTVGTSTDYTFKTLAVLSVPTLSTSAASPISTTTATLNGSITFDGNASSTVRGFNYGLSTAYGSTASTTGTYGTGSYSLPISGLVCGTTYHFQAYATNSQGTGSSTDATFMTSSCPVYSISASPNSLFANSGNTVVSLVGSSTLWTIGTPGTPTFTLSGGTGASIASQSVSAATAASLVINPGTAAGTLLLTDPSTGATTTVSVVLAATPTISAVATPSTSTSTATITWTTATSSDSLINYGLTTSYGSSTYSSTQTASHLVTLTGLSAGTTYHFQVVSSGPYGNTATSSDQSFTTSANPPVPPTLTASAATSVSTSSATFNGTIVYEGYASSTVEGFNYGITTAYGLTASSTGLFGRGSYSMVVTGLLPSTTYHYQAYSTNPAGTGTSTDQTFTTSALPAPVISSVSASTTPTSAIIIWTTDQAASSTINYGSTTAYGSASSSAALVTSHSITITGLSSNATYHYQIAGANSYGTVGTSTDNTFTTTLTLSAPAVTAQAATSVSTTTATLNGSITFDGNASSTVEGFNYGTTIAYGQTASSTGTFGVGSFSQALSGLVANTTYHYQAYATNGQGTGTSSDATFTTSAAPAPMISGVSVSTTTSSTALITWTTDQAASSSVNYGTSTSYGTNFASSTLVTTHNVVISSLSPNVTYHFRVGGANSSGVVSTSSDYTLTTLPTWPTTSTQTATSVTSFGATLVGNLSSSGGTTTTQEGFIYGITSSYGSTTINTGTFSNGYYSISVTGLYCATTYHYRAYAANGYANNNANNDVSFTTSACPTATAAGEIQFNDAIPYQFGTTPPYYPADTVASAYDANYNTFWDTLQATSSAIGLDLRAPAQLTRIRVAPRNGENETIYGSLVQGSSTSSPNGTWTTVHTITTADGYFPQRQLNDIYVNTGGQSFRYYRLLMGVSTSTNGTIEEVRFIGKPGAATPYIPVPPVIAPYGGYYSKPILVRISSATTDATIYYTTDGTVPGFSGGVPTGTTQTYTGPFTITGTDATTTVQAIAVSQGQYVSEPSVPAYFYTNDVRPAQSWYDVNDPEGSQLIESHDGGISYFNGRYYWYGQIMNTNHPEEEAVGVSVYSSADLVNWENDGAAFYASGTISIERPHVLYNDTTHKYVMWGHTILGYPNDLAFIAESDTPTGPFTLVNAYYNPEGLGMGDITAWKDTDGTGYLAWSEGDNNRFVIAKLSSDYLSTTGTYSFIPVEAHMEGPALFKYNGVYYLFTSQQTGWFANTNSYSTTTNPITGTWSPLVNPFQPSGQQDYTTAYQSQTTDILPVNGRNNGSFIYVGDRNDGTNTIQGSLYSTRPVLLPLNMASNGAVTINWQQNWNLDGAFTTQTYPGAASGLTLTNNSSSNSLSWTNNATTTYSLYVDRATDSAFTQNVISDSIISTSTSYTDTYSVNPATNYYYRIRTVTAAGTGNSSTVSSLGGSLSLTATSTSPVYAGTTGNVINLTGSGSPWTSGTPGSPTFTLSGGSGASITSQAVTSATAASIIVTAGTSTGALTITDPSTGATANVSVVSDTVPPTVMILAPVASSTVSGTTTISATAADNVAVASISVYIDGGLLAATSSQSFSAIWNTTGYTNGSTHMITAVATDSSGNAATTSESVIVNNLVYSAPTVTVQAATGIATSSATINGTISFDGNASSTIEGFNYGTTALYGQTASTTGTYGVGSFSQTLAGLLPSTTYHYQAFATNNRGTGTSTDQTFTTSALSAPVISSVSVSTSTTSATITWTTDQAASSTVSYGTTTSYGSASSSAALTTSHAITISGLAANTAYHYQIAGANSYGTVGTSSDLTFKTAIALSAPTVSESAVTSIGTSSATFNGAIVFDGNASSTVEGFNYGITSAYGQVASTTGTYGNGSYSISLASLVPGTTYHVQAYATNNQGTGTSTDVTFTTSALPAPVASSVASSTTQTTATVTWTTDQMASSTVNYGSTSAYGSASSTASLTTSHTIAISGLAADTVYHFQVAGANSYGTVGTSTDYTFKTLAMISSPSMSISSASAIATSSATLNGTITSDGNASTTVRGFNYGTTLAYGSVASTTGTYGNGAYSLSVTGLAPNTTYHYQAFATNGQGTGTSTDQTFTTSMLPIPMISAVATSTSPTTATISWTTDIVASSTVNYGLTTGYGSASTTAALTTSHTITLSGLTANTLYHFQVAGASSFGAVSTSSDYTFVTPLSLSTPVVTAQAASSIATSSAALNGTITSDGNASTTVRGFNYGTTAAYGLVASTTGTYGMGAYSLVIAGLLPGTTYHYQAYTTNNQGTGTSSDQTFTTSALSVPVIASIVASTTQTSAVISWTTDQAATSTFQYGSTGSYGSTVLDSNSTTTHSATLSGLNPGATYHFKISAASTFGVIGTTTDQTFVTAMALAPALTVQPASSVATSSATLNGSIVSDGYASSTVEGFNYGITSTYGSVASTTGMYSTGAYSLAIAGLIPGTTYHYQAFAVNSTGTGTSSDQTFTTSALPAPAISSVATSTTQTTATITWNTDQAASSTVNYGLTTGYGMASSSMALAMSHTIMLSGLAANSTYHFQVAGANSFGTVGTSTDYTFVTGSYAIPVISNVISTSTYTTATVTWNTDLAATSTFQYGLTTAYGSTVVDATATTSHSVSLSGLNPGATYHFKIGAGSSNGTVGTTSDATFVTPAAPSPVIGSVSSTPTATAAIVTWVTDLAGSSTFQFGTSTAYGSTVLDPTSTTSHSVSLSLLVPSTTYHFKIGAVSGSFGTVSSTTDQTFVTGAGMAPTVTAQAASSITTTGATLNGTITLDGTASSTVRGFDYGTTTSYGLISSTVGTFGVGAYSATLSSLACNTTYHYQAFATNGQGTGTSSDQTFVTSSCPDVTPPNVAVTAPAASSTVHGTSVTLTASSSDNVGVTGVQLYVDSTAVGSSGNTSPYSATWDSTLVSDGTHSVIAVAHDAAGNYATSTAVSVTVSNSGPAISTVTASAATSSATIAWSTDVNADSQAEYGLSSAYTASSTYSSTLAQSHTVVLFGLTPNTTYHYRVISVNGLGNRSASSDFSFMTAALPTPSTQGSPILATSSDSGISSADGVTNVTMPTFIGTASSSALVYVYDNSQLLGTTTANVGGAWSFIPPAPLSPDGTHLITSAQSVAGVLSATSPALTITLDTAHPTISLATASSSPVSDAFVLTASASEPIYNLGLGSFQVANGAASSFTSMGSSTYSVVVTPTNSGTTTVSIGSNAFGDLAGNQNSATTTFSIGVNLLAPSIGSVTTTTGDTTAQITWNTNSNTASRVAYGFSLPYNNTTVTADVSPRVKAHTVSLTGLTACTLYHYAVVSTDMYSVTSTSSDATFTTTGCTAEANVTASTEAVVPVSTGGQTSLNQLTLTAPANFTSTSTSVVFQAKQIDSGTFFGQAGTPTGTTTNVSSAGVVNLSALSGTSTLISNFTTPLTVMMSYTADDALHFVESTLKIYRYDSPSWYALNNCNVDTNARTVTCTTPSFSDFALFGTATTTSGGAGTLYNNGLSGSGPNLVWINGYPYLVGSQAAIQAEQAEMAASGGSSGSTGPIYSSSGGSSATVATATTTSTQPATAPAATQTYCVMTVQGQVCYIMTPIPGWSGGSSASSSAAASGTNSATSGSSASVAAGTTAFGSYVWPRTLKVGQSGADVLKLQQYLNTHGFVIATSGAGSLGHETMTFGSKTALAVAAFQKANGIRPTSGYFGPLTRAFLNQLVSK